MHLSCSSILITVLSGTLIAVLGLIFTQILNFFIFERIREFNELQGKASELLVFWAHVYSNGNTSDGEVWTRASNDLRGIAARLFGFSNKRHCLLFFLPSKSYISKSARAFIGLSNSKDVHDFHTIINFRDEIETNLRIKTDK